MKNSHSLSLSVSDYYPAGILCPGGHSEGSAKPHWCWISDLCPFGFEKPATSWVADSVGYRYAFNGKEIDTIGMGGGGSTYDYGFRIYNAQIAKFLSVDPLFKSFPWNSTYAFAENDVIRAVDLDGLEKLVYNYLVDDKGKATIQLPTYAFVDKNKQMINGPLGDGTLTFLHFSQHETAVGFYTFLSDDGRVVTSPWHKVSWAEINNNRKGKSWLERIDDALYGGDKNRVRKGNSFDFVEKWLLQNIDQNNIQSLFDIIGDPRILKNSQPNYYDFDVEYFDIEVDNNTPIVKPDTNWKRCATNDTVLFRKSEKGGYETSTGHTFILEPDYPINDSVSNVNYRLSNENKE